MPIVLAIALAATLQTGDVPEDRLARIVEAAGKVTIEIPVFEGGEGMDFFLECAREYERERPNVTVNLYGDPRIKDKVQVRILEGSMFEVTNAFINYWPLIRNGDVLPLDQYLDGPNWEGDNTWRGSFLPGSLDVYNYEDQLYGIPFMYAVQAIWYNKGMFEEHGWRKPTTWDEFFALCDEIEAAGIPPLAFQGRYVGYAQAMIEGAYYHSAGRERLYGLKRIEPGSFDCPEFVEALRMAQRASDYFEDGAMGMSHTEAQMSFFNGGAAMIPCGSWLKSEMLGKIPDGFRLGSFNIPIPSETRQDPGAIAVGTNYYFTMAKSAHPEIGLDFLRFMTSREQAAKFSKMRDIPTAVRGGSDVTEDMAEIMAMIENAQEVYGVAPGEGYPEMVQYWTDNISKLLNQKGKKDATPEVLAKKWESDAAGVRDRKENPTKVSIRHTREPFIFIGLLLLGVTYWAASTLRMKRKRGPSQPDPEAPASSLRLRAGNILLFVGPAFALYTVFVIVPCLRSFQWSLYDWDGITPNMTYVGFTHFKRLLCDMDHFWVAIKNNLFIMFVVPAVVLPLSLFLAACISRGLWGSTLFRIVFFFPNILGVVAGTLLWLQIYNPNGGPITALNTVLAWIGHGFLWVDGGLDNAGLAFLSGPFAWLGTRLSAFENWVWLQPDHLYKALIPMSVWGGCGFNMILFLAAMESIPTSLYEAADLDGASAWRQFWTITFPLIWDVLSIAIIFSIIGGMKAFEVIWLLTNQATPSELHVIGTYMVSSMFTDLKVGQATAIAVLLFIMVFVGTGVTWRAMRRESVEF